MQSLIWTPKLCKVFLIIVIWLWSWSQSLPADESINLQSHSAPARESAVWSSHRDLTAMRSTVIAIVPVIFDVVVAVGVVISVRFLVTVLSLEWFDYCWILSQTWPSKILLITTHNVSGTNISDVYCFMTERFAMSSKVIGPVKIPWTVCCRCVRGQNAKCVLLKKKKLNGYNAERT